MKDVARCIRPLTCPTCQLSLIRDGKRYVCAAGHSYDLAREGYVNLLPTGKRLADTVGDSAEMLRARRRFLASGLYAPLASRVAQLAVKIVTGYAQYSKTAVSILDCGCGEGYYLEQVRRRLAAEPFPLCTFGLDVAKTAVKMAAKKYPHTQFVAADVNGRLPFADHSIHLLLNLFAPRNPAEFARIGAGSLLIVIPAPNHLQQVRQTLNLLTIESAKQSKIEAQLRPFFPHLHAETLTIPLELDNQQLQDLVHMTPNARHLTLEQIQQIAQIPRLQTEAQFQLLLFRKPVK